MKDTPFGRITRSVRWLRYALFGVVPLLIVLIGGLYWGWQRILAEQEEKLSVHFVVTLRYIGQHERFLWHLQDQNARRNELEQGGMAALQRLSLSGQPGRYLFRGQGHGTHLPFSLLCAAPDCPDKNAHVMGLGQYLADTYTAYWATQPMPSGNAFLLDRDSSLSLAAPGIGAKVGATPLTQPSFLAIDRKIRAAWDGTMGLRGHGQPLIGRQVLWLRDPELPHTMIGVVRAPMFQGTWQAATGRQADIYAATALKLSRISLYESARGDLPYDNFWLSHRGQGQLVGDGKQPDITNDEIPKGDRPTRIYTADGLYFNFESRSHQWNAQYHLGYAKLFNDNFWLPIEAALLLLLGLGAAIGFARWHNRGVLEPALKAQRELIENEAFNRTLVDAAPVALCVLNKVQGGLVFGNALATSWLGHIENADADSPQLRQLRTRLMSIDGPGVIRDFIAADGRPLQVAYTPTRYHQRDVILCAFTDVSAHAEMERTLARAKRDADRASAAKSTFLATMSHEIRTPLYGVLGTLELLELTPLNKEQQRHLETIKSSSGVLLQIISDILDTTRIETGQMALEMETFNPRHLCEDVVAAFTAMAWQKNLLLFACIDPNIPTTLRGDPGRIRQILSNLVSNAIKFTHAGHVIVRFDCKQIQAGQRLLEMAVEDTGIGIDAEHRPKLFEPFYQIDAGEHMFRGAGLGLAICMQLAKLMGSRIELSSEPGVGSRFSMTLSLAVESDQDESPEQGLAGTHIQVRADHPELAANVCAWLQRYGAQAMPARQPLLAASPQDVLLDVLLRDAVPPADWQGRYVAATSAMAASLPGGQTADGHRIDSMVETLISVTRRSETEPPAATGKIVPESIPVQRVPYAMYEPLRAHVLVAEDNPINRVTLSHQLEQLGCTVVAAVDGAEALAYWHSGQGFDVVLTDINMPNVDGYQLTRTLRDEGAQVVIIGVTANALREEEGRCKDAGMDAWLVKPISLRMLRQQLIKGLRSHVRGQVKTPDEVMAVIPEPIFQNGADADKDTDALPLQYWALAVDTMRSDILHLRDCLDKNRPDEAAATVHRMRGAMAVMQMEEVLERFTTSEVQLRESGITEGVRAAMDAAIAALDERLEQL